MPMRELTTFEVELEFCVIDPIALGRKAWEAAQSGGFTSLKEWREYRREQGRGLPAVFAEIICAGIAPHDAGLELNSYR